MKRRSTLQLFVLLALPACEDGKRSPTPAAAPEPTAPGPTAPGPTAPGPTAATRQTRVEDAAGPTDDDPISAMLTIPRVDVAAGAAGSYRMHGDGDDHHHYVQLEPKHMLALRDAQDLVLRSGPASTDRHLHWVRVMQAKS